LGLLALLAALLLSAPFAAPLRSSLDRLFAFNSQQAMWFLTRAAGIMAYLLLWFSTVWGLAIPSKFFADVLNGEFAFDFHQFISLLSLGFLFLHVFILTADRYLPYSLAQDLVPFLSPYRPVWVGIGSIAFYLILLVTVTFYMRKRIGMKAFRYIHYTSLLAYLGSVVHSVMSGSDSSVPAVMIMYIVTTLVVVFLTAYWILAGLLHKKGTAAVGSGTDLTRPALLRDYPTSKSSYPTSYVGGTPRRLPVRSSIETRPRKRN
jgi:predicted ferric reductase